ESGSSVANTWATSSTRSRRGGPPCLQPRRSAWRWSMGLCGCPWTAGSDRCPEAHLQCVASLRNWHVQQESAMQESESSWKPSVSTSDQRSHERHDYGVQVQVSWMQGGAPGPAINIQAVDIAKGGLGLVSRSMVHPKTRGIVLLPNGKEGIVRCIE